MRKFPHIVHHERPLISYSDRFTYTIPTVILELGYTAAIAVSQIRVASSLERAVLLTCTQQLMTIPVYIFAMIVVIVWALISDHYGVRSTFIVIGFSSAVIGLVALLAIPHPKFPGLTYFFLFLTAAGIYCPQQLIVSWTGKYSSPLTLQPTNAHQQTTPLPPANGP